MDFQEDTEDHLAAFRVAFREDPQAAFPVDSEDHLTVASRVDFPVDSREDSPVVEAEAEAEAEQDLTVPPNFPLASTGWRSPPQSVKPSETPWPLTQPLHGTTNE